MENPRPEKVAVVDEVKERLSSSDAVLLTEYRGLNVAELAQLRRSLRTAGGDYKIYKNTLVRLAARDLGLDLEELLIGPTAIAFVGPDGGDPVTVAKALREFSKGNPNLVVKGGMLADKRLSPAETKALSEVAPREELLARFAGGLAAPLQQFAGLLQALPRNFAFGLAALIAEGGGPDAPAAEQATAAPAEPSAAPAEPEPTSESSADPDPETETDPQTEPVADATTTPTEES